MSQIKLLHSGGNGVILSAPDSNPASDRTLKLPGDTDGTVDTLSRAGNILQVVHVNSNTHMSSTSTSYVDLTGVTATITPSSSSNKILIVCSIAISKEANHSFIGRIVKDGSAISGAGGVAESGHGNQEDGAWWLIRTTPHATNSCTVQYLDSPATTSATTYKAQGKTSNSSQGFALNRTKNGEDQLYASPTFSSITLWEVAA